MAVCSTCSASRTCVSSESNNIYLVSCILFSDQQAKVLGNGPEVRANPEQIALVRVDIIAFTVYRQE